MQQIENNQFSAAAEHLVRAQRLVVEIMSGLNPSYGELPEKIQQLCIFVSSCITNGKAEDIQAALRILGQLREGYEQIREEAIELENQGVIPSIHDSQEFQAIA